MYLVLSQPLTGSLTCEVQALLSLVFSFVYWGLFLALFSGSNKQMCLGNKDKNFLVSPFIILQPVRRATMAALCTAKKLNLTLLTLQPVG